MSSMPRIVRYALATHLHTNMASLHDEQRLEEDLDLAPLDVVWVAMRVEALHANSGTFPVERLSDAHTVGDLIDAFEEWDAERAEMPLSPTG